jgi:hypothetical protein
MGAYVTGLDLLVLACCLVALVAALLQLGAGE